ncbi:MAG: FAD/NAD(P)-binding oxidoreductase [Gammaproteobacteria bacterium]|jgi:sulfide:quinone oxidoreductase
MELSRIAVVGAGVGGISQAFELRDALRGKAEIHLINDGEYFEFTPSNPWVAVGWRKAEQIRVELAPLCRKLGIRFSAAGLSALRPGSNELELGDGSSLSYDFLVIATGPQLAFDEVPGLGPEGFTTSVCKTNHAQRALEDVEALCRNPGPVVVGAAPGASCFGPAYEYAYILETELRRRKIRDRVPMTYVTPEPYIGHLGLDGVGDTKSLMESEFRNRHIHWITNAKIQEVLDGSMRVEQVDEDGATRKLHELPFEHAMILPAFRGVDPVCDIEGLVNPRGFVLIDEYQRNPRFKNIYSVGVCVAIPPVSQTPVPTGTPKTGYMIESMVTATTHNIVDAIAGNEPRHRATWNALCLADFGDSGVAFVAVPQIPPRNTNWSAKGKWVHTAKVAFEKYFLNKVRRGKAETYYEKIVLQLMGVDKIKASS